MQKRRKQIKKTGLKQNVAAQTLSPIVLYWTSGAYDGKMWVQLVRHDTVFMSLLTVIHIAFHWGWLHTGLTVSSVNFHVSGASDILGSPLWLWLISRFPYTDLSGPPCMSFWVFHWDLGGCHPASNTLAFCLLIVWALYGWNQNLLSFWAAARKYWTMIVRASECLDGWALWKIL